MLEKSERRFTICTEFISVIWCPQVLYSEQNVLHSQIPTSSPSTVQVQPDE